MFVSVRATVFLLLKILILATIYFVTGKSGLTLGAVSRFATLVWPPTGIAFAALLLWGLDLWPGVALGAFLVNYATGALIPVALGIATGNTLEAIAGVFLLRTFFSFDPRLNRLKDVLGFIIVAALGSTLISATLGATSLLLGNTISLSTYPITWITWWVGDILGDVIVASVILVWVSQYNLRFHIRKALFLFLSFAVLLFVTHIVFTGFLGVNTKMLPIEYLLIPPLLWITLQFGQQASVSAMFLVTVIAIWETVNGHGVFSRQNLSESLLLLQGFIGVNACTFLILSAVVSEFKELESRKDAFVALASHELKTPVTSLKMFVQLLLQRFTKNRDSQTIAVLRKMNKQIDRQVELVAELLDISRIQAGKLEYRMETFFLDDLIMETIENMQAIARSHTLKFIGSGKNTVYADRDRIGQVLINIITNAIKYSPHAEKVIIRVRSNKHSVQVSIQDFGNGIGESDQEKIFQQFFQISSTLHRTYPGLGLGLYIASQIIKRHRGKIWVESREGKGSTFSFTLPL